MYQCNIYYTLNRQNMQYIEKNNVGDKLPDYQNKYEKGDKICFLYYMKIRIFW